MNDLQIIAALSALLSDLEIPHAVAGSLASSAWGEQRYTNDADFLLGLDPDKAASFLSRLPEGFHVEESDIHQALSSHSPFPSFQLLFEPAMFKIDCFVAGDAWQLEKLGRAKRLEIWEGVFVPFASPEDMIIAKCRWFDLGHRISDRQWNDLMRLYEVQRFNLDTAYIERWLGHFGLMDLWEEIQRQAKA